MDFTQFLHRYVGISTAKISIKIWAKPERNIFIHKIVLSFILKINMYSYIINFTHVCYAKNNSIWSANCKSNARQQKMNETMRGQLQEIVTEQEACANDMQIND